MTTGKANDSTIELGISLAGRSHIGRVRENNEDAYLIDPCHAELAEDGVWKLFGIADGLGGHEAGEIASELALDSVEEALAPIGAEAHELEDGWKGHLAERIHGAFALADRAVHEHVESHPERSGMGTTLVIGLMVRGWLGIAHVGDSRAYLVREAGIQQLTTDHNWAEDERKKGMSEQALRESPFRSMLTRAIGVEDRFQPDISWTRMEPGDLVVLATDGLTHYADSDTLLGLVTNGTDLAGVATGLIDFANDGGGRDNITVVLARFDGLAGSPLPDPDTDD